MATSLRAWRPHVFQATFIGAWGAAATGVWWLFPDITSIYLSWPPREILWEFQLEIRETMINWLSPLGVPPPKPMIHGIPGDEFELYFAFLLGAAIAEVSYLSLVPRFQPLHPATRTAGRIALWTATLAPTLAAARSLASGIFLLYPDGLAVFMAPLVTYRLLKEWSLGKRARFIVVLPALLTYALVAVKLIAYAGRWELRFFLLALGAACGLLCAVGAGSAKPIEHTEDLRPVNAA